MKEIDIRISKRLQKVARRIEELLRREIGEDVGFGLVIFPWAGEGRQHAAGEQSECQYISNAPRAHMHGALRAIVKRWDGGHADVPPHLKQ